MHERLRGPTSYRVTLKENNNLTASNPHNPLLTQILEMTLYSAECKRNCADFCNWISWNDHKVCFVCKSKEEWCQVQFLVSPCTPSPHEKVRHHTRTTASGTPSNPIFQMKRSPCTGDAASVFALGVYVQYVCVCVCVLFIGQLHSSLVWLIYRPYISVRTEANRILFSLSLSLTHTLRNAWTHI